MTTTEEPTTLVTQDMIDAKGVWGAETTSYAVGASDIRKWALATYWPEKPPEIHWDEEYAAGTRWGSIIATRDFNPFTWPVDRPARASAGPVPGQTPKKGENILNGGQQDSFFAPIKPGDVITSKTRLSHWNEREGRHGLTIFTFTETEWHNQDGELVKRRMSTGVRY